MRPLPLLQLQLYLFAAGFSQEPPARFLLNDPSHAGIENRLYVDHTNLTLINLRLKTVFLIHGYSEDGFMYYFKEMPIQYALKGEYNVIGVDWGKIASRPYIFEKSKCKKVGGFLGEFIIALHEAGMDLNQVHLVGHSLGAHVAGFAGKHVLRAVGKKIHRISGLDPAGPGFVWVIFDNSANRLSKDDAGMVDVVHTDAFFGIYKVLGTVDFYANGGAGFQPGCPDLSLSLQANIFCSHQNSVRYFTEAINSNRFLSCDSKSNLPKCWSGNQVVFGEDTPFGTTGVYYFNTNSKRPYAQGG